MFDANFSIKRFNYYYIINKW